MWDKYKCDKYTNELQRIFQMLRKSLYHIMMFFDMFMRRRLSSSWKFVSNQCILLSRNLMMSVSGVKCWSKVKNHRIQFQPSLDGRTKIIKSNSWLQGTTQNSIPMFENVVQTFLELRQFGLCPLPWAASSRTPLPLVKNLSPVPTWPSPSTAPCLLLENLNLWNVHLHFKQ